MTNVRLLIAFAAFQFILFPIPIITLFWKDQIGMSLADIMILQAIFGMSVVLFEFGHRHTRGAVQRLKTLHQL